MGKYGSSSARNHGYGKQLGYAGRQALSERYGGGHFATVRSHAERWADFAGWAREQYGIRDARSLSREHVAAYGRELAERGLARSSVQNRLSTVNVTLAQMRGDQALRVSPSEIAGQRSSVREVAPVTADRDTYTSGVEALRAAGHERAASTLELARELGVREREAALLDLPRAAREARNGYVNIQEGTKGGRDAPRWVPVTDRGREAIERAARTAPAGSRNLIDPSERYIDTRRSIESARGIMREQGVPGYHDARAAYAVERYRELTGADAPVVAGERRADKATDREAREAIAHELGHGRTDVAAAYLGSAR